MGHFIIMFTQFRVANFARLLDVAQNPNCRRFSVRPFQNNLSTCDWDGLRCLANASDLLDSVRPMDSTLTFVHSSGAECSCPPACSTTKYASTSSSAKFPNKASRFYRLGTYKKNDFTENSLRPFHEKKCIVSSQQRRSQYGSCLL